MRRGQLAAGCAQLTRDVNYYNEKHNPGDPVQLDLDFSKDMADNEQSCEYDDSPPAEPESEGGGA